MSAVTIVASLPSVRLGLAEMLASHGHTVMTEDDVNDAASVWVLDAPSAPALDAVTAQRYSDSPRAAVVLSDDAGMAQQLARAGLRGWAVLARDADAEQLDLAVRSVEAGLVLLDLPVAATSLTPAALVAAPTQAIEPLTARELQVLQLVAQGLDHGQGQGVALGRPVDPDEREVAVALGPDHDCCCDETTAATAAAAAATWRGSAQ